MDGSFFVAFRERHPGRRLAERRYLESFPRETDSFPVVKFFFWRATPGKKSLCVIHEAADSSLNPARAGIASSRRSDRVLA